MIQITPQMRVLVATEAVDFRRGIDGLAEICRRELASDPFSGTVFVFRNRRCTGLRVLVYDGRGFWLCYLRLSRGRFRWWPPAGRGRVSTLQAHELAVLFSGGDPRLSGAPSPWRPVERGWEGE